MKILVVDDDLVMSEGLSEYFQARGHEVRSAHRKADVMEACGHQAPDWIFLDQILPDGNGFDLIPELKIRHRMARILVLTGFPDTQDRARVLRMGADEYLSKPPRFPRIEQILVQESVPSTRRSSAPPKIHASPYLPLAHPVMKEVYEKVEKAGRLKSVPVLIYGETGTGKKHLAELIHGMRGRGDSPFVEINCGAVPETLFESELFGYEAGAYTDARKAKPGLLEQAGDGVVFLDEVAELAAGVQAKLLKVLDQRKMRRVGGLAEIPLDFRLVSATNKRLDAEVEAGRFRRDLYFRLRGLEIQLPPLRSIPEAIPELADFFLRQAGAESGLDLPRLDAGLEGLLKAYAWPGNIRELKHAVFTAVALCDGGKIQASHLPPEISRPRVSRPDIMTLRQYEFESTTRALAAAKWNFSKAARLLGITRQTVAKRVKKYGIEPG